MLLIVLQIFFAAPFPGRTEALSPTPSLLVLWSGAVNGQSQVALLANIRPRPELLLNGVVPQEVQQVWVDVRELFESQELQHA